MRLVHSAIVSAAAPADCLRTKAWHASGTKALRISMYALKSKLALLTALAHGSNCHSPLLDSLSGQHPTCCCVSCSAGDSQQEWQELQDGGDPYQGRPLHTEATHHSNGPELPDEETGAIEPISVAEPSTAMALKVRFHAPLGRPCCEPALWCAVRIGAWRSRGSWWRGVGCAHPELRTYASLQLGDRGSPRSFTT